MFEKVGMESTIEEDLQDVSCVRVVCLSEDVDVSRNLAQWGEKQYLILVGTKRKTVELYGRQIGNMVDVDTGYVLPGTSGCIVYSDGIVEALGDPILRLKNGKKQEVPVYDTIEKVTLAPGLGPLRKVATWMSEAKTKRNSMAFTGAGISAESGVPTYRDVGGLWTTFNAMEVSSIKGLARDPRKVWKFEEMFFSLLRKVSYNPGHKAMANMEERGYLKGIVTQNVDGLHQSSGSTEVVELHGSEVNAVCLKCKKRTPMTTVFDDLIPAGEPTTDDYKILHPDPERNKVLRQQLSRYAESCKKSSSSDSSDSSSTGSVPSTKSLKSIKSTDSVKDGPRVPSCPMCPHCQGFLKPDGVYFGEPLIKGTLRKSVRMVVASEVILLVGTSGKVNPARQLPILARKDPDPSKVVEVNPNSTLLSHHADIRLIGPSADILPALLAEIERIEGPETAVTIEQVKTTGDAGAREIETEVLQQMLREEYKEAMPDLKTV